MFLRLYILYRKIKPNALHGVIGINLGAGKRWGGEGEAVARIEVATLLCVTHLERVCSLGRTLREKAVRKKK